MRNLPIELLRTFVAVCDAGSVTIAAEHIGLSQPAMSLQIKRLEELLESRLFLRIKKRLEPSEAGLKLYPKARKMLNLGDEILNEFRQPELQGHVCLGLPSEFATTLLPAILGRFSSSYPNVALEVVCDLSRNLLSATQQQRFDLTLSLHNQSSKERIGYIKSDQLVWVGSANHRSENKKEIPLVLAQDGCIYRQKALNQLNNADRPWRLAHTNPDLSGIQAAIEAGLGITVLAKSTVPPSLIIIESERDLPALGSIDICVTTRSSRSKDSAAMRLSEYIRLSLL